MKKSLLASLLALAFVGSANAAVVTVTTSVTLPVGNANGDITVGAPGLGGTSSPQYWEIVGGTNHAPVEITYGGSFRPDNSPLVWDIYADIDGAIGSGNTGTLLASGTIGGVGNPASATYLFLANTQYILKFSATAQGTGATLSDVPVPAAAWLFGSALFGAGALRRKQKSA